MILQVTRSLTYLNSRRVSPSYESILSTQATSASVAQLNLSNSHMSLRTRDLSNWTNNNNHLTVSENHAYITFIQHNP